MHGLVDVSCPDRSSQAIDHIVGLRQHLLLGVEARYDNHRAKHFLLDDLSVVAIFSNYRRLEEVAFFKSFDGGTFAAGYDVGSCSQGTLDEALDGFALSGGDQWTHIGQLLRGITDTNLLNLVEERVQEGIVNAILDIDACSGCTVLTAVNESANHRAIGSRFQISIIINDEWGLTAKLKMNMFDGLGARTHDVLATFRTACDGDHIDFVMAGKGLCYTRATG